MTRVGIKTIGFVEQNEVDDQWVVQQEQQEQQAERSVIEPVYINGLRRFGSFDQGNASLSEKSTINESGKAYDLDLAFVVRKTKDITLGKKYLNRPLVLHVWTVDGKHYKIGTKSYPAYLESDNRYENVNNRELAMTVKYQSRTSILT